MTSIRDVMVILECMEVSIIVSFFPIHVIYERGVGIIAVADGGISRNRLTSNSGLPSQAH
jgi:hypothetical protein